MNNADIVFEEIVEGTLTRFAAVFHSQDADPVGPIRSGRSQDVDMLGPFNGPAFAWSGGNAGVRALIRNSDFINLDAGFTPGYYRRSGRGGAPHNLYSSTAALWANVPPEEMAAPPSIFSYLRPEETFTGQPATSIDVPMDGIRVRWEWDAGSGVYRRFHEREQPRDRGRRPGRRRQRRGDGRRLPPQCGRRATARRHRRSGRVRCTCSPTGMMRTGVWIHLDRLDQYGLVAPDGSIIALPPGRTWIELAHNAENFVTFQA